MCKPATTATLAKGDAYPLGAHWTGTGVNFALVAPHAHAVELCLFDAAGEVETARLSMPGRSSGAWHAFLPGAAPGLVYGYRVHGPKLPERGHRFDPAVVLLDPYARDIVGAFKARVTAGQYDWGDDRPPRCPPDRTILYELHVKGFTQRHPGVPEGLRGSYAGLAHPAALDHLAQLGITSVSLLPLHQHADEPRLLALGLSNYWGYNTIGFFAPEPRYWSGRAGTTPAGELRDMVKALHARGIEVILDVVYNHSAEGDEHGPTLSMRGIDNLLYYHLKPGDLAHYENWTGCGNCLNLAQPRVLQLVMDSLRYWVQEMHVDGFRFDLGPALARDANGVSRRSAFYAALRQDPVLAGAKLIAEPWDLGPDGYQLGNFPDGWLEWNDQYRDTMRAFWLGEGVTPGQFALRFAGSSDLFEHHGRDPAASVNFICAHDGFTLRDLVSYDKRHNAANGEDNRDGHAHNLSWNCGVEGDTSEPEVLALRARLQRALLATLMFSQGTPMLLAGAELGQTQRGNNNPYCQDSELSWLDWRDGAPLTGYLRQLIALRQRYPALRRPNWHADILWFAPSGAAIVDQAWHDPTSRSLGFRLDCDGAESVLILVNAGAHAVDHSLPPGAWRILLDSAEPGAAPCQRQASTLVPARAVLLAVEVPPSTLE